MLDSHKDFYINKILPYVNTRNNKKENEELLNLLMEITPKDIFIKFYSQLDWIIDALENSENYNSDFEKIYDMIKNCKDEKLLEEVLGTAFALNKKARMFYYYFILRKYDNNEINTAIFNEYQDNILELLKVKK